MHLLIKFSSHFHLFYNSKGKEKINLSGKKNYHKLLFRESLCLHGHQAAPRDPPDNLHVSHAQVELYIVFSYVHSVQYILPKCTLYKDTKNIESTLVHTDSYVYNTLDMDT